MRRELVAKTPGGVEDVPPRPLHLLPVTPSEHVLKVLAPHQPRLHHVQLSVDIVEASDDESISTRVVLFNLAKDGLGDMFPGAAPFPSVANHGSVPHEYFEVPRPENVNKVQLPE